MQKGKVLALDYGKKRIGVASGDFETKISFPRDVILNDGVDGVVEKIKTLCEELSVVEIVIGLPLNMDFEHLENEMLQEVKKFASLLTKGLEGVRVTLFDERLSSYEAGQIMKESREAYGADKQLPKDAYAAQIILQRFFDNLSD